MAEFKTVSLADQVFEKLEDDIITGVYARGEILTELKLVEQLGVSRTPIREALRRLEQERLIMDSGKGSVVLGITLEDLIDIMNIRLRVEGLATYYDTQNLTEEVKKELSRSMSSRNFISKRRILNICGRWMTGSTSVFTAFPVVRFLRIPCAPSIRKCSASGKFPFRTAPVQRHPLWSIRPYITLL